MRRHDDEHGRDAGRTVAALPPARGRGFAQSWWGRAWLRALEDAALEAAVVKAGRRLARAGGVGAVTVRPGRVTAVVRAPGGAVHRADVLLPELSDTEWGRFEDLAVEQAGHMAALLDRELPPHLIEDAAVAGIDLLPGLGDLDPACDCGAWDHCGHTAALCQQMARLLDEDPFLLLLLRGREKDVFLAELHIRGTARHAEPAAVEGVDAAEAWAAADIVPPLPALPPLPSAPGAPASLASLAAGPAAAPEVDSAALEHLAGRTAVAAYRLLAATRCGDDAGDGEMTAAQDAVRLACGAAPAAVAERLAVGSGRGHDGLATAVRAWRTGGAEALAVLDEEWQAEGVALARARAVLEGAWEADERPALHRSGNRWTVRDEGVQLRLGREGRWWPYREEGGRWIPAGGADRDPAAALVCARLGTQMPAREPS
ncbi:SWF or SNF family helicase [Streptomyces naphthomycinicus]|uniref:SWF or SNF family helicase n=1 Tax=Streptomyces naphthomycinicus TaxID=2872625 RepID=UPI001CED7A79|nr:SWF or SNF family helicase [Streptomyces sp. TML10]